MLNQNNEAKFSLTSVVTRNGNQNDKMKNKNSAILQYYLIQILL